MTSVFSDFARWCWRLVPANPILVRVVYAGGKRTKHFWARVGYLGGLFVVALMGVWFAQAESAGSLSDLAKGATVVFRNVALVQLLAVLLLAPIFAAAAITQERDSQTYDILLATPLTNAQIVFGTLLSRLFFVFALLAAGLPFFTMMMVYGGVTFREIAYATGLAASSAMVAGALAVAISVIRVGTRRTIFSFYVLIGLYLMAVYAVSAFFIVPEAVPAPGKDTRLSWLAAFHPLLALGSVLNQTPPPRFADVAHYGFPWRYFAAYPAASYIVMTSGFAVALCLACVSFVRAQVKAGESKWLGRLMGSGPLDATDDRRRNPRRVWDNAVAWREAMTRASGRGRAWQRLGVIALGLLAAFVLLYLYATGLPHDVTQAALRAIIGIELELSLLVATNSAATGLTREKETGTLEVLLVTPLVSRDILWGKVRGFYSSAVLMVSVPVAGILLFLAYDLASGRMWSKNGPIVNPEALLTLPLVVLSALAFASTLGLYYSVNCTRTTQAVAWSVAVLLGVCGVGGCLWTFMIDASALLSALSFPFTPITAAMLTIQPAGILTSDSGAPLSPSQLGHYRLVLFVSSLAACGVYWAVAVALYKNMIREWDMTIRKQMR